MFSNIFNNSSKIILRRGCSISSTSTVTSQKWDLLTAVCIERKPVITPLPNDLEKEYMQYLQDVEQEKSFKSNFEVRMENDLKQAELLKQGTVDIDVLTKQTAQDFLDANTEELNKFKFADRITNADKTNDHKSLNRKLDKHLVLLIKQKLGNRSYYLLPQAIRNDGETLRQTADRLLKDYCGDDLKAQIYGNAPVGFYKYKYPEEVRGKGGSVGAKMFVYFARYNKGEFRKEGIDFKWLDRIELEDELQPNYYNSIGQFLIDEN